ncbi:hypothetical protein SBV1_gp13 [Sulfolobales Beppu virus 1]|nr:hypothetical protein SBV1_gp13 [Sulfolobales Beppu virus 1]
MSSILPIISDSWYDGFSLIESTVPTPRTMTQIFSSEGVSITPSPLLDTLTFDLLSFWATPLLIVGVDASPLSKQWLQFFAGLFLNMNDALITYFNVLSKYANLVIQYAYALGVNQADVSGYFSAFFTQLQNTINAVAKQLINIINSMLSSLSYTINIDVNISYTVAGNESYTLSGSAQIVLSNFRLIQIWATGVHGTNLNILHGFGIGVDVTVYSSLQGQYVTSSSSQIIDIPSTQFTHIVWYNPNPYDYVAQNVFLEMAGIQIIDTHAITPYSSTPQTVTVYNVPYGGSPSQYFGFTYDDTYGTNGVNDFVEFTVQTIWYLLTRVYTTPPLTPPYINGDTIYINGNPYTIQFAVNVPYTYTNQNTTPVNPNVTEIQTNGITYYLWLKSPIPYNIISPGSMYGSLYAWLENYPGWNAFDSESVPAPTQVTVTINPSQFQTPFYVYFDYPPLIIQKFNVLLQNLSTAIGNLKYLGAYLAMNFATGNSANPFIYPPAGCLSFNQNGSLVSLLSPGGYPLQSLTLLEIAPNTVLAVYTNSNGVTSTGVLQTIPSACSLYAIFNQTAKYVFIDQYADINYVGFANQVVSKKQNLTLFNTGLIVISASKPIIDPEDYIDLVATVPLTVNIFANNVGVSGVTLHKFGSEGVFELDPQTSSTSSAYQNPTNSSDSISSPIVTTTTSVITTTSSSPSPSPVTISSAITVVTSKPGLLQEIIKILSNPIVIILLVVVILLAFYDINKKR